MRSSTLWAEDGSGQPPPRAEGPWQPSPALRAKRSRPRFVWTRKLTCGGLVLAMFGFAARTEAGPNLMAIGNYEEMPFKRAEGRESFSAKESAAKEIIFEFDDPAFDFGRVIVRSNQPSSVVRRDLFVGFTGNGLGINTAAPASGGRGGGNIQVQEVEFWLRIKGQLRPGKSYEWEFESPEGEDVQSGLPALIPAMWVNGEQIGAEVSIREPEGQFDDRIQRLLIPHGIVTLPSFQGDPSGAWVVILPRISGNSFTIGRFSFREVDTDRTSGLATSMPSPVRYIPIRSIIEDQIASTLERSAEALRSRRTAEFFWEGGSPEGNVLTTAQVLAALAEINPKAEGLGDSMRWLGAQRSPTGGAWGVQTSATYLYCLSRHGGLAEHRSVIQSQVEFLADAQRSDGGWSASAAPGGSGRGGAQSTSAGRSDPDLSFFVLTALREARFAGAEVDRKVWRDVMQYWGGLTTYDGGFGRGASGISQATNSADTATGAAALLAAVDLASGVGSKKCTAYLGNAQQLKAIAQALEWLDKNYQKTFRNLGSLVFRADPYLEADRLQELGSVSGLATFNKKDHFLESAESLLRHLDPATSLFGVRGDSDNWLEQASVGRTAAALSIMGVGAAPPVCQRMIVGDKENGWSQLSGDVHHLVRYLARQRGRQFNWRRTDIDRPIEELVKVPILIVNVVGPFQWSEAEWAKLRQYCFAGGSVIFDLVNPEDGQREAVVAGLGQAFPEFKLADLAGDHPLFSIETTMAKKPAVKALGNGFRDFLFLPSESWSCQFQANAVTEHEEAFQFVNNLLTYALDGTEPRSAFAPSTLPGSAVAGKTMTAAHLEIGGNRPAHPQLVEHLDRLMRANFRTGVERAADGKPVDFLWVSVTGEADASAARDQILSALRGGKYLFVDVVAGNEGADETFRGRLRAMDPGISLELLSRTDPVFTGEIAGTVGFDAVQVELRPALRTRFSTRGRCDLFRIRYQGKPAGVYSAYDLSSGVGYQLFPKCRGVMPEGARELVMNALLNAYAWKLNGGPIE